MGLFNLKKEKILNGLDEKKINLNSKEEKEILESIKELTFKRATNIGFGTEIMTVYELVRLQFINLLALKEQEITNEKLDKLNELCTQNQESEDKLNTLIEQNKEIEYKFNLLLQQNKKLNDKFDQLIEILKNK